MIAYVEGTVIALEDDSCVVLTANGVGYEVNLPGHIRTAISAKGQTVSLYALTVVREDSLDLYGFNDWDERQTFSILLSVSKVGPKLAMAILSQYRPDDLRGLVASEDIQALTRVPGIGKKSAQHILLELKYKLKTGDSPVKAVAPPGSKAASIFRDTLAGLTNLGYQEDEARPVLETLFKEDPDLDVSEALRAALKKLAKGRL